MSTINFVWDEMSDNVLLETDENDSISAEYQYRPEQFGELLSQSQSGSDSFFHFDGEFSTHELTDSNEDVTDTFGFTAYGEEVVRTGSTANPFGYKGKVGYYTNEESSDIYVRARTYDPAVGRWLSSDPFGFVDGASLYRAYFVPNSIDPTGACECCCCPVDITLSDVDLILEPHYKFTENIHYGLRFRVIAELSRTETRIEGDTECKIEWYECSISGANLGQKPNEWFVIPGFPPVNSESNWHDEYTGACPGSYSRYWQDTPSIINATGFRTTIKFAVRVTGPPDCNCIPDEKKIFFTLDVVVLKGGGAFDPPQTKPDPPVLTPGIDKGEPKECTSSNVPWVDPWE